MFNELLYERYDQPGKIALSGYLTNRGNIVYEGTKFGIDLTGTSICGRWIGAEVEVKRLGIWGSGNLFPFESLRFSNRKERLAIEGVYFFVLNESFTEGLGVSSQHFLQSPIVLISGDRGLEQFREVSTTRCIPISLYL